MPGHLFCGPTAYQVAINVRDMKRGGFFGGVSVKLKYLIRNDVSGY